MDEEVEVEVEVERWRREGGISESRFSSSTWDCAIEATQSFCEMAVWMRAWAREVEPPKI